MRISTGLEALGSVVDVVSVLTRLGLCAWVLAGFADVMPFRFRPGDPEVFIATVAADIVL